MPGLVPGLVPQASSQSQWTIYSVLEIFFPHFCVFQQYIYTHTTRELQSQQMDEIIKKGEAAKESTKAIVFDLWICSSLRSSEHSLIRAISD